MKPSSKVHPQAVRALVRVLVLGATLALFLSPAPAVAQDHEHAPPGGREFQEPIHEAFLEITPQVRRALGLFPDVENFSSARLFLLEGGGYVLEVASVVDGRIERERTLMTEYDLRILREDIESRMESSDASIGMNREGRGGLVLRQTVLGIGFYGWAVPAILDMSNDRAIVATYLLTAGASFYLPYRMTRGINVSDAHRGFSLWGGTRGIAHGLMLGRVLMGAEDQMEPYDSDWNDRDRVFLGTALAGSIAGSWLAFRAVDRMPVDEGTTRLWGAFGDYGILAGLGTAYALGLLEDDREYSFDGTPGLIGDPPRLRLGHSVALGVSAAGLYAGMKLGERESYTVGNVTALNSMTALGVQAVLPLMDLVDADDQVAVAGAIAGGVAGIVMGNRLLRPEAFSEGDGLLLLAGHLAGGLSAAGITYLLDGSRNSSGNDDRSLLYLTTSALGSAAGFALTFRALDNRRGGAGREAYGGASGDVGGYASRDALGIGLLPGRGAALTIEPTAALAAFLPALSGGSGGDGASAGAGATGRVGVTARAGFGGGGAQAPHRLSLVTVRF